MKNILKKSYKLNKFKNMLVYGVRAITAASPTIAVLLYEKNFALLFLQIITIYPLVFFNIKSTKSEIKKFINKKYINQINNRIDDILINLRKNELTHEDIKDIASLILMKKEILALNNVIVKNDNLLNLYDENLVFNKYTALVNTVFENISKYKKEYKKHIDEYMFDEKENLNLKLIFKYVRASYNYNSIKRLKFILSESYTLKKEDYHDLNEIIKNLDKYSNYDLFNFLKEENLKADWNFIKEMIIKDYNSDNFNYEKLIKLLDSKKIESYSNYQTALDLSNYKKEEKTNNQEIDEKIKNHILFDYNMKNNKELWFNLKSSYQYLVENNYQQEVEVLLNESLPILIDFDMKIDKFKSKKIKEQTIENSKQILVLLNKDLLEIIENMENNKSKDIKILAKYKSMKM